jgi:hypothetical protein
MTEMPTPVGARTPFGERETRAMILLVIVGGVAGIVVSATTQQWNPELSKVFAAGAATLWFGALLGGVVTLLIADVDRRRLRRAAEIEYINNLLSDLKTIYDQVDRGRSLIAAHRSAKTYHDEMLNFIAARIQLRQVVRAVSFDPRGSVVSAVRSDVEDMEEYLGRLVDEFEQKYKGISREQSIYEAKMKTATTSDSLPDDTPWKRIRELQRMRDFLPPMGEQATPAQVESDYKREFLDPLDRATEQLRNALAMQYADSGARRGK